MSTLTYCQPFRPNINKQRASRLRFRIELNLIDISSSGKHFLWITTEMFHNRIISPLMASHTSHTLWLQSFVSINWFGIIAGLFRPSDVQQTVVNNWISLSCVHLQYANWCSWVYLHISGVEPVGIQQIDSDLLPSTSVLANKKPFKSVISQSAINIARVASPVPFTSTASAASTPALAKCNFLLQPIVNVIYVLTAASPVYCACYYLPVFLMLLLFRKTPVQY